MSVPILTVTGLPCASILTGSHNGGASGDPISRPQLLAGFHSKERPEPGLFISLRPSRFLSGQQSGDLMAILNAPYFKQSLTESMKDKRTPLVQVTGALFMEYVDQPKPRLTLFVTQAQTVARNEPADLPAKAGAAGTGDLKPEAGTNIKTQYESPF